jgi:Rrf2 family transcriptional regulator, nitric oxide-sensitive transcriptional repressor
MLSQTAEYALRAVVHLAAAGDEVSQNVPQIAASTKVPQGYLSKVLQQLVRGGVIVSQRGIGGGFRLIKPASQLTLYEVVQAVDPIKRIETCPLKLPQHRDKLCPAHKCLDDAIATVEAQFRATTIDQLVGDPPLIPARPPKKKR